MHVMIDLETMSTEPNAAIASVGAVKFDKSGITDTFYATVDLKDCKRLGLDFSESTIKWWSHESRAEALRALHINTRPLKDVLVDFSKWYGHVSVPTWGCGSDFDNIILKSGYTAVGMTPPWKFWHNRCYRTIRDEFELPRPVMEGVAHNALDDATHQAKTLMQFWNA